MENFQSDYFVCDCKKVRLGEVITAIKHKGANTVADIGEITKAGTSCGSCVSKEGDIGDPKMQLYLVDILQNLAKN